MKKDTKSFIINSSLKGFTHLYKMLILSSLLILASGCSQEIPCSQYNTATLRYKGCEKGAVIGKAYNACLKKLAEDKVEYTCPSQANYECLKEAKEANCEVAVKPPEKGFIESFFNIQTPYEKKMQETFLKRSNQIEKSTTK